MKRIAFVVALALAVAACSGGEGEPATTTTTGVLADFDEVDFYENLWTQASSGSYLLTYRNDCGECLPSDQGPFTLDVRSWTLAGVTDATGSRIPAELWSGPASVEDLFGLIRAAIAGGSTVEVVYDSAIGVPLEISIDMEQRVVDGGTHLIITGFDDDPRVLAGALLTDLEAARARWNAAQSGTYSFTYTRDCFCPEEYRGPFEFDIVDGVRTQVRFKGEPYFDRALEEFETIDDIFDEVERAIEQGAASVNVEFDPDLGYPRSVWIDWELQMADEEMGYTVSDVRL